MDYISEKRLWLPLILMTSFVLLAAGFTAIFRHPNPVPVSIRKSSNFTVFYPTKLPEHYSIDKDSFETRSGVVTFTVTDGDHRIFVSEQTKPQGFDFKKLSDQDMNNASKFTTSLGEVSIGKLGNSSSASFVGVDSWVLITQPSSGSPKNLETITRSLKAAN